MLTKRRVIVLMCVLALLGGCVWVLELFYSPFAAEAELMVRPRSEIDAPFGEHGGDRASEDQSVVAQNVAQLLRSRSVIAAALRSASLMDHVQLLRQADPEGYVLKRLEVEVKQPGLILVRMTDRDSPDLCADLANAIVDACVKRVVESERAQKLQVLSRLEKHLATQSELEKKGRAELESLHQMLGPTDREPRAQIAFAEVQAEQLKLAAGRSYEKLVDLCLVDAEVGDAANRMRLPRPVPLALEPDGKSQGDVVVMQTTTTDWVIAPSTVPTEETAERNWDAKNRLAMFRRYEEEYQRNMADLGQVLEQIAAARHALAEGASSGKKSFDLETRQHELDLVREQVDELVRMKLKAELALESGSRVEVMSPAVKPVSRRHWFGWGSDAE